VTAITESLSYCHSTLETNKRDLKRDEWEQMQGGNILQKNSLCSEELWYKIYSVTYHLLCVKSAGTVRT
jgi:hypothetical protein